MIKAEFRAELFGPLQPAFGLSQNPATITSRSGDVKQSACALYTWSISTTTDRPLLLNFVEVSEPKDVVVGTVSSQLLC